jgi:hypothetical protein
MEGSVMVYGKFNVPNNAQAEYEFPYSEAQVSSETVGPLRVRGMLNRAFMPLLAVVKRSHRLQIFLGGSL